jgi:peptide subunit release factor 1 (eRF1)
MKNLLQKLAGFEPTGFPFLNFYLNAQVNENGQRTFDVFVRNQLNEAEKNYAEETSERESFNRDAKKILDYLETVRPTAQGVAIFACAGADDFFETIELDMPIDEDYFFISDRPHLYPLAHLRDRYPRYAVLLADTNSAQIYVFGRGRTFSHEEIQSTKTNRTEVGGWSQMRYQRHIDNFHKQHAKECIDELEKIVRDDQIKRIILCGNEAVIIPLLRGEMSKEMEEKVIDVLSLPVTTSQDELFEATQVTLQQYNSTSDMEKIQQLLEQNYDGGLGVVGVERTLEALQNGQVQELFLSANLDVIRYNRKKVARVLEAYAPGADEEELPNAEDSVEVVDELVRQALASADTITFIEDENLLKDYGGVGALLRYTMTATPVNHARQGG